MSGWVRFENTTPEAIDRKTMHREMPSLSDKAFRLWFNATCFCSRAETDGRIPMDRALTLSATASKKVVQELLSAGLFEIVDRTYVVHDYLDYNPTRARVQELKEQGKARVSKHRSNAVSGASQEPHVTHDPLRVRAVRSVPIPSVLAVEETETTQGFSSSADDELPTGFPVELTPHLNAAEAVLADLAARHGSKAVTRMSLASVIAGRPRKPLVKSAWDFASWADGKAQKRRDVVSGYRNWLDRTDDLAATERFGVDAGVPSTGDTYEQRRALRAAAASRVLAERSAQ
jgi:hypothetical protein